METIQGSVLSYSSELDLGSLPYSDVGIQSSEFHTYYPVFSIKDPGNPLQFIIPSTQSLYTDLSSAFLYFKIRILKENGKSIVDTDIVAPSHNFYRSLFTSCEVTLNSTVVSKSSSLYAYKAHILDTLCHGSGYKSSQLSRQLFLMDSKPDTFSTENTSFVTRGTYCLESSPFEVIGRISESVFESSRFFPPGVEVRVSLRRSDPSFCLDGTEPAAGAKFPYQIVFDDATLYVRKYVVNPRILALHNQILSSKQKFYYPVKSFETRSFNIAIGTQSISSETLFRSILPEYLILTLVDSAAFSGKLSKGCFSFQPFDLQSVSVSLDGDSTMYRQLDFNTSNSLALLG